MAVGKRSSKRPLQEVLGKGANINADNPLEVHDPKVGSLISFEGITTADGAGDGSSLIDSVLATKPDYDGNLCVITSGAYAGQARDIDGTTTGTVNPTTPFGGQILRGTSFVIVALRLTPAEVAAIEAKLDLPAIDSVLVATIAQVIGNKGDAALQAVAVTASLMRYVKGLITALGDPTGDTLATFTAKWGDIARSLDLILGARWDAAGDLGTDITTILAAVAQIYQEQIPDTDFALAAIDNVLTNPPPNADAENSIVDIDQVADSTFVLRSLWVNITSFGTEGTKLTFKLWVMLNTAVVEVDSVEVANVTGIQNLMDLFGLPEVHADGIWITVQTDSVEDPGDAACSGTYRYAEAKK